MTPTTRETADHAELAQLAEAATEYVTARSLMTSDSRTWRRVDMATVAYHEAVNRIEASTVLALLSEIAALRGELHSEERFMRSYPEAVRRGHWESVARLLSGRLREMDKRAKAANIAREQAERQRDGLIEAAAARNSLLEITERQRDELRKALEPFAEAAEGLYDATRDHDHIWEQPAAMSIDAGHLRAARTLISNQGADQ